MLKNSGSLNSNSQNIAKSIPTNLAFTKRSNIFKRFYKKLRAHGYHHNLLVLMLRGASIPLRFILNWLGAYLYGPFVMGAFSTTRSFLDISITLAGLGSDKTMIRFLSYAYAKGKQTFINTFIALSTLLFTTSVIFGGLICIFSSAIANFYHQPEFSIFFKITGITIPAIVLLILVQQAYRASKHPYLATLFETALFNSLVMTAIILLFYSGYKTIGFHLGFLIGAGATLMLGIILLIKLNYSAISALQLNHIKKALQGIPNIFKVGLILAGVNVVYLILLNLDRLVLPKFASAEQVGIYYIATRTGMFIQLVSIAFLSITPPHISKMVMQKKANQLFNYVKQQTLFASILALLVLIVIYPFVPFLLKLFGHVYQQGTTIALLSMVATFALLVGSIPGQAIIIMNKHKALFKGLLIWLPIAVLLTWILGSSWGATGVILATIISAIAQSIIQWGIFVSGVKRL